MCCTLSSCLLRSSINIGQQYVSQFVCSKCFETDLVLPAEIFHVVLFSTPQFHHSNKFSVNAFSFIRWLVLHKFITTVILKSIPQHWVLLMILCLKWWKAKEQWDGEKCRYESLSKGCTICLQEKVSEARFKETSLSVLHPS